MDNAVKNTEGGIQAGQPAPEMEAGPGPADGVVKKGPGLKTSAAGGQTDHTQDTPAPKVNPALKYGRRMDYKTAKVNDKQTKDLNLSLSSLNAPVPKAKPKEETQEEEKSALELELEALEAAANAASQPIHNPLPTPKKRVPKEMEFDIEPPEYAMHFDLVELNGKDYFDIN